MGYFYKSTKKSWHRSDPPPFWQCRDFHGAYFGHPSLLDNVTTATATARHLQLHFIITRLWQLEIFCLLRQWIDAPAFTGFDHEMLFVTTLLLSFFSPPYHARQPYHAPPPPFVRTIDLPHIRRGGNTIKAFVIILKSIVTTIPPNVITKLKHNSWF